jgi:hypothetical protein
MTKSQKNLKGRNHKFQSASAGAAFFGIWVLRFGYFLGFGHWDLGFPHIGISRQTIVADE